MFVLVQNDEGRAPLDDTFWTRDGVLSALESKNVILNTLTREGTPADRFFITTPALFNACSNYCLAA